MENLFSELQPIVLAMILDLSAKHSMQVKPALEPLFLNLREEDLYYDVENGECINGKHAAHTFTICGTKSFESVCKAICVMKPFKTHKKHIILAVDFYKGYNFLNLVKNNPDINFLFLKIGKHNPELHANVGEFYFNNVQELVEIAKRSML